MKTENTVDGGHAFPTKRESDDPRTNGWKMENGMSLRDVFAAVAMHAMISRGHDALNIGRKAYIAADDMLDARKGGEA